MNYIVSSVAPFRSVENEDFRKLIEGLQPDLKAPNRRRMADMVKVEAENVRAKLILELAGVQHVSTSADLWTGMKSLRK
jgi:hypothetical protein